MTASAPVGNVPQGCSVKLTAYASSFRNAPPNGGAHDVSSDMIWRSSDTSKFTVNRHGLAIAASSSGTAVITATGWQGEFNVTLTAGAPVLVSIMVGPFDSSVNVAGTVNYTALGLWSDGAATSGAGGNIRPFPSAVTWGVNGNQDASGGQASIVGTAIDKATATGTIAGIVQITAANSGITGGTYLNVGLTGITISPAPSVSVPKGETQQFDATLIFNSVSFNDPNTRNYVRWNSLNSQVARIGSAIPFCTMSCPTAGLARNFAQGTTTIAAVSGSISNTSSLTVTAPVVTSLNISYQGCNPANVPLGVSCQFEAIATYSDQTMANVTNSTTWISGNPACVAMSATALATTLNPPSNPPNPCNSDISATFGGVSSTPLMVTMHVTAHVLRNVTITPNHPTVAKGNQQPFGIVEHWTDGNQIKTGSTCPSWTSSSPSVATIVSNSGLATAVNPGTATIGFSSNCLGFQPSAVMTVVPAQLQTITVAAINPEPVTPPDLSNTTIPVAAKQDFMATGNYSDGSHTDITDEVTWTLSGPLGVATMNDPNDPNEATGVGPGGPVTVTATDSSGTITGTASLMVKQISFITVSPSAPQMVSVGGTAQFTATANYPGPVTQVLTNFNPTWSSNPASVATVDQTGLATGVDGGSATITATMGAVSCPAGGGNCGSVMASAAVLQSIAVSCDPSDPCQMSGGSALLSLGRNEQMIATGHYSDNSTQDLTSLATWAPASGNLPVNVDSTGFLTTKSLGSTNVTATCNAGTCGAQSTVQGTLPVTVTF